MNVMWRAEGEYFLFTKQLDGSWKVLVHSTQPPVEGPTVMLYDVQQRVVKDGDIKRRAVDAVVYSTSPDPQKYEQPKKQWSGVCRYFPP